MITKLLSKFVMSTTDELASGMLSSPLGARVEELLSAGRRFARGASIAAVVAIGAALLGTVTIASRSPAWVAFAQAPIAASSADALVVSPVDAPILLAQALPAAPGAPANPATPAAPKPTRAPNASTLSALLAQDQLGAQLKELEAARIELLQAQTELANSKALLQAQKAILDSQAQMLAEEAKIQRESVGPRALAALQRDIYDLSKKLQEIAKELQEQRVNRQ